MSFRQGPIDVFVVLGVVLVDDCVAFVVVAPANQPAEDAIVIVCNAAVRRLPVDGRDVLTADRAPVDGSAVPLCPPLDSSKEPFDAWPISMNGVLARGIEIIESAAIVAQNGYEILGA